MPEQPLLQLFYLTMLGRRLTLKLASSLVAATLTSMSPTVTAQTTSLKTLSMEEFSDLERVKQTLELAPDSLRNLADFQPANLSVLPGRLLRVTLREEFEVEGKIVRAGTKVIESARGHPGYYFIKGKGTLSGLDNYEIYFLNLWKLAGRHYFDSKPLIGSNSISESTGYVSELKLTSRFEDAMVPGASWAYEKTYETETSSLRGAKMMKSGSLSYVAEECRNGQDAPASDLHPKLSGKMIPIQCHSKALAIGNNVKLAYLKDYGFFMPITRRHVPVTRMQDSNATHYMIVGIEFDPLPIKSN